MDDRPNNEAGTVTSDLTQPKETPCVSASPDDYVLKDINTAALAAAREIVKLQEDEYEYGVIIYAVDGVIGMTKPFTSYSRDTIGWNVSGVPSGAHILAIVHNHPDDPRTDDRIPSMEGEPNDWDAYQTIRDADLPRNITVDSKMLAYIYTNEDWNLYVYDRNDRGTGQTSCTVNQTQITG